MERPELLACIEEPVAEPDRRQEDQQAEPVEAAMWEAMEGLAQFSQASVIHHIGVFVRLEAIRTEKHQTRFQRVMTVSIPCSPPFSSQRYLMNVFRS
jgi:hypothetical protein